VETRLWPEGRVRAKKYRIPDELHANTAVDQDKDQEKSKAQNRRRVASWSQARKKRAKTQIEQRTMSPGQQ
jgi:hypothetical protein